MEALLEPFAGLSVRAQPSCTVIDTSSAQLQASMDILRNASVLALDCEGVDLGRKGKICIVQLSTKEHSFLFDVHEMRKTHEIALALKEILQSPTILKVIHDCKQDSDALYHHLGIQLTHVHDTQCWQKIVLDTEPNLNDTLESYGLSSNVARNSSVYRENPAFWAVRPLTDLMISWASGDVALLIDLYERQLSSIDDPEERAQTIEKVSQASNSLARTLPLMKVELCLIDPDKMGMFIGKGGSNARKLRDQFRGDAFLHTTHTSGEILVYAMDKAVMKDVKRVLARYA
eukprot:gene26275-31740_t